ncbi:hypothetical protein D1007_48400 [Hordeum vulgare]|nr:hypothetical protein D1007_48400 [Hordeum vulgare]
MVLELRRPGDPPPQYAGSSNAPPMPQNHGHEPRRSRRTNVVQEAAHNTCDGSDKSDSSESEWDSEWVDSDNELAKDDDDLFNEWADTDFGKKTKKGSKREVDSDYDSDDFEEKKDSDNEEDDSAEEVEVVDAQGKNRENESEAEKVE